MIGRYGIGKSHTIERTTGGYRQTKRQDEVMTDQGTSQASAAPTGKTKEEDKRTERKREMKNGNTGKARGISSYITAINGILIAA